MFGLFFRSDDAFSGAGFFAFAAADAFVIIDDRVSAGCADGVLRADLFAFFAGDTADLAVGHDRFAFFGIDAGDVCCVSVGHADDHAFRAGLHTLFAADAFFFIDYGYAFDDGDRVVVTDLYAVAEA